MTTWWFRREHTHTCVRAMCMMTSDDFCMYDIGEKELFTPRRVDAELVEELNDDAIDKLFNGLDRVAQILLRALL